MARVLKVAAAGVVGALMGTWSWFALIPEPVGIILPISWGGLAAWWMARSER